MNIVAISGSLRKASYNTRLARAAAEHVGGGHTIDVVTIHGIPLYDGDVEAAGFPDAVSAMKDKIAGANALLLVTPEYNNSIPGPMKNAIDWCTRPAADIARVFKGKPCGVIGASPGPGGTRLAQTAWLPVLRQLQVVPYFGHLLYVDSAGKAFDDAGAITEPKVKERLTAYLEGFVAFAARFAPASP